MLLWPERLYRHGNVNDTTIATMSIHDLQPSSVIVEAVEETAVEVEITLDGGLDAMPGHEQPAHCSFDQYGGVY